MKRQQPQTEPGTVDLPPEPMPAAERPVVGGPGDPPPVSTSEPSPSAPAASHRTRISTAYVGVAGGLVMLVLVVVFMAQNLSNASVHYLGLHFRLPVGLLMLIALVAGGLIVFFVSLARVAQLRVRGRRAEHRHLDRP